MPSKPVPPSVPDRDNPLFNQSLEKGLEVLRAFNGVHRTLTLSELAALTGMNKSSAQRTIHTLEALGYVDKHPQTRRFRLTPQVMEIGYNYLAADALIPVASPYLSQLAAASGETANLTEPVGLDMVYVAQLMTAKHMPVLTPVGMRIPMYCTSSGRAYLSTLPDEQVLAMLEQSARVARTPATLTGVDAIFERVAACRRLATPAMKRNCSSATWAWPRHRQQPGRGGRRGARVAAGQPLGHGRGAEKAGAAGDGMRAGDLALDRPLRPGTGNAGQLAQGGRTPECQCLSRTLAAIYAEGVGAAPSRSGIVISALIGGHMKFPALLLAASMTAGWSSFAQAAGCQYDMQCKGERICQQGQCVFPDAEEMPEAGGPAPLSATKRTPAPPPPRGCCTVQASLSCHRPPPRIPAWRAAMRARG